MRRDLTGKSKEGSSGLVDLHDKEHHAEPNDGRQTLERLVQQALAGSGDGATPDSSNAELVKVLLSERYSGSFPHPDLLRQFDDVIPNGAERAFALTEREQCHRHECDKLLINSEVECKSKEATDRRLLIVLGFVFLTLSVAGALVMIMTGHPLGLAIGGSGVLLGAGGLIAFVRKFASKQA